MNVPHSATPSDAVHHAVELLKQPDDIPFHRWLDICEDPFVVDAHGNGLMHWAAALGQLRALKALISSGMDLEATNSSGATPLLCAAASARNPGSVLAFFIRRGARTEATNAGGIDMFDLLERRGLTELREVFALLCEATARCPRLFTASGYDPSDDISCSTTGPLLGTDACLAQPMSTVRFASRNGTAEDAFARRATKQGPPGNGPASLSVGFGVLSFEHVFEFLIQEELVGRSAVEGDYNEDVIAFSTDLLQMTVWLYNNLVQEVYTDEEEEGEVEEEPGTEADVEEVEEEEPGTEEEDVSQAEPQPDPVDAVLGERHDMDGERVLLVQWNRPSIVADAEPAPPAGINDVEWVLLREIATSAVVQQYVVRFDKTYSQTDLTNDGGSSFGLDRTASQRGLDDDERDELERLLGMIPPRLLSLEESDSWRQWGQVNFDKTPLRYKTVESASFTSEEERSPAMAFGFVSEDVRGLPGAEDLLRTVRTPERGAMAIPQGPVNSFMDSPSARASLTSPARVTTTCPQLSDSAPPRACDADTARTQPTAPLLAGGGLDPGHRGSFPSSSGHILKGFAGTDSTAAPSPVHNRTAPAAVHISPQESRSVPSQLVVTATEGMAGGARRFSSRQDAASTTTPAPAALVSHHAQEEQQSPPEKESPPGQRDRLSTAEKLKYQRFLYQSAMERVRARNASAALALQQQQAL